MFFIIYGHGGVSGHVTGTKYITFLPPLPCGCIRNYMYIEICLVVLEEKSFETLTTNN